MAKVTMEFAMQVTKGEQISQVTCFCDDFQLTAELVAFRCDAAMGKQSAPVLAVSTWRQPISKLLCVGKH